MTTKKAYRYILGLFVVGLIASIWFVQYASGWLTSSSTELTTIRSEVEQLEKKRIGLEDAKKTLRDKDSDIETLEKVLPTDKDQARVVEEIYKIAAEAGVTIESVGFPASTLGNQTTPKPVVATDATTTNASDQPQQSTTVAPKAVSQATPVKEIPGVQSIDLSIGAINSTTLPTGTGIRYSELIAFMKLLERNQRTIQIRSLGIGQDQVINGENTFSLNVALTIYIRA